MLQRDGQRGLDLLVVVQLEAVATDRARRGVDDVGGAVGDALDGDRQGLECLGSGVVAAGRSSLVVDHERTYRFAARQQSTVLFRAEICPPVSLRFALRKRPATGCNASGLVPSGIT